MMMTNTIPLEFPFYLKIHFFAIHICSTSIFFFFFSAQIEKIYCR
jgi:hypothetical protein